MKTLVIAECGSCHDGSIDKAIALIDAAKAAGADCAKFQYWSDADALAKRRHAPSYLDIYRRYQLPLAWLPALAAYCESVGIDFMATTYLPQDVAIVAPFVPRFKISSFEALDWHLWQAHIVHKKRVVVSVGMLADAEWRTFLKAMRMRGTFADLLHCVSAYPCQRHELNLGVIRHYGLAGFSDHSGDVWTGYAAVMAGARIVEAHMRLPETDADNPDAGAFALTPVDFASYVTMIREAEVTLGDGVKQRQPSELEMARYRVA